MCYLQSGNKYYNKADQTLTAQPDVAGKFSDNNDSQSLS